MIVFNSSTGEKLSIEAVVNEIVSFMMVDLEREYKITLGTDSEGLNGKRTDFVTAIVVHRVGNGGRYFWRHTETGKFHTLRDRVIKEVMISLDMAKELLSVLEKATVKKDGSVIPRWDFEIHVDVGENGKTQKMIQELVGMIRAHNYEARTKPGSYAASSVADRHV